MMKISIHSGYSEGCDHDFAFEFTFLALIMSFF